MLRILNLLSPINMLISHPFNLLCLTYLIRKMNYHPMKSRSLDSKIIGFLVGEVVVYPYLILSLVVKVVVVTSVLVSCVICEYLHNVAEVEVNI